MFNIVVALLLCQQVFATEDARLNKTKRTVAQHLHHYGDRPVMLYADSTGSSSNFYGPVPPPHPQELPKQVAAQQVLYEYQQTPTNAYSNVHVNQYYQPLKPEINAQNQYINEAESVAAPVQHTTFIRHGQNVAQYPQAGQSYAPGKYLYVNGRIIYQPSQHVPQAQFKPVASYQFNNPYPQLPQKYVTPNAAPQPQQQTQFQPQLQPQLQQAWGFNRKFQPPQPHQMQQITKPMQTITEEPTNEEQEEEADDEETPKEDVEEQDYEEESEDDDDNRQYFGKYRYEDDDDESGYEGEEDEDSDRGSSRHVPKKHTKRKNGNKKGNNYKYSENYSSSSEYDKPWKSGNKQTKKSAKPKMKYTSVKYSKVNGGKPKIERIQGRQSQNVPVVHKQKIVQHKWYVTQNTEDTTTNPQ